MRLNWKVLLLLEKLNCQLKVKNRVERKEEKEKESRLIKKEHQQLVKKENKDLQKRKKQIGKDLLKNKRKEEGRNVQKWLINRRKLMQKKFKRELEKLKLN